MAGKTHQDRELASEVRSLCLNEIKGIFKYEPIGEKVDDHMLQLKNQLILKMSTSILPRLNEVSGIDGEPLSVIVPKPVADAFGIKENERESN